MSHSPDQNKIKHASNRPRITRIDHLTLNIRKQLLHRAIIAQERHFCEKRAKRETETTVLTTTRTSAIVPPLFGAWRSWLARLVWDQEALGSSPSAPTTDICEAYIPAPCIFPAFVPVPCTRISYFSRIRHSAYPMQQKSPYPHKTAGSLMSSTNEVPVVKLGSSLQEVEKLLEANAKKYVSIDYIYVVDNQQKLKGIFSIKECFSHKKESLVDDIMQKHIIAAKPHTHQENVGLQALTHGLKQVPVVEESGVFLGVIQYDVIMKVLDREAVENALRASGISGKDAYDNLSNMTLGVAEISLPWLLIGLIGGLLGKNCRWLKKHFGKISFSRLSFSRRLYGRCGAYANGSIVSGSCHGSKTGIRKYVTRQFPVIVITGRSRPASGYFWHGTLWK